MTTTRNPGPVHRWCVRLVTVVYAALFWLAIVYLVVPRLDRLDPSWRQMTHWPGFAAILWLVPVALFMAIGVYACWLAARGTVGAARRWLGR